MSIDYSTITELAGDDITVEQMERLCHRYSWAKTYCEEKDVIEAACGTGPGLGYLAQSAKNLRAGDYSESILSIARQHYVDRIELRQFDAQDMPYDAQSADVIILFEAIYYLPNARRFVQECCRVLRAGGKVLIATANKDLYDFNPSPHSYVYYGVVELQQLFSKQGFDVECFGYLSIRDVSLRQRLLRPAKKLAVSLDLMPKTNESKKFLKRIVFGRMVTMPAEIVEDRREYNPPTPLPLSEPDQEHKAIYCVATLPG